MSTFKVIPQFRDLIPPPTSEERQALFASIEREGVLYPLVVWAEENILLDGHTRREIANALGTADADLPTITRSFASAADAMAWMIENQCGRRNLSASQRAMLAAKLATLKPGDNQHTKEDTPIGGTSQSDAAAKMAVSPRAVQRAAKVLREGTPELAQAVTAGDVSVSRAAAIAELPQEEQAAAIADSTADGQAAEPTPRPERNGNNLATKAICILAKISKDDFDRKSAFERVRSWLDENE